MSITAGTYFLNALALDYPLIEWIETVKAFCDEVVLVDMGSEDGTPRAIRSRFGNTVRIIKEKWQLNKDYHEGVPRNRILSAAQMQWVYLTDADEILHEKSFDMVKGLTKNVSTDFYRFGLIDFYGSCYLRMQSKSEKPALIRNGQGLYFGAVNNSSKVDAHTLLINNAQPAKQHCKHTKIGDVLFHYGRCRIPRGIAASHKFYMLQYQARQGLKVDPNQIFRDEDHIIKRPDSSDTKFTKWTGTHPLIVQRWVQQHWKIHGWEV